MNTPPNREVALFSAALELPASQRAAYLDEACADDPALRLRLEALLRDHEAAGAFLETPPPGARESPIGAEVSTGTIRLSGSPAEKAGDRIGRYKLLQQIGEGGCGVVYMAEQEEPVRRRVALKVIKLGMDTKQVVARFEAERQALALMDHPNIAKVLDAGATDTGRPYFVMDLVRGIKITNFCDENKVSTEDRLKLFIQVCQAIQHAHQKGIIHRDIKPSNILVADHDGLPVPKIIDFGIAKATTDQRLTDKTLFTAFEQFMGTPAYMSPEQAKLSGLDIDTRSDIYSLGVLLYELLTGSTPFDSKALMQAGLDEIRRTIREQEPERPSTRLSTMAAADLTEVAKQRHAEPAQLGSLIRGDLDWIVMKALEKDRARRYETANGLARDIQRHLNCEAVVARPPSRLYEFQKTVQRHKLGFAAAAALLTVLAVGVVVSTSEAIRATQAVREQSRLRQQAEQAGNVAKRQEQLARESADEARRQQGLASEQELLARRRFYAAQMNLANQAVEAGQLGRALALLETQRPKAAAEDLRTFEWYHLWGLCNARLRVTLRGHKEPVNSVAISPDGKTLASASQDSTIRLWNISTGLEGFTLKLPPGNPVFAVAFTPDGKTLAAGNWDGLVRLWDVASGKLRATLPFQHGWVRSLAISPDGGYLVCGGDRLIRVFDLATKTDQTTLSAHRDSVVSIAFSKDGGKLASASGWGSDGGSIKVWNVAHGLVQPKLQIPFPASAMAFSPDGKMLATLRQNKGQSIQVWDTSTGQLLATLKGLSPPLNALVWLPDGKALVSCASDRTIRLWPMTPTNGVVSTNSVVAESQIIGEHLDLAMCLAISADGTTLASGASDGSVKLWNVAQTREQAEAKFASSFQIQSGSTSGAPWSLLFSPDGGRLFVVTGRGTAARDIVSGQDYPTLPGAARSGALTPDGKRLATGDREGTVKLWDHANERQLATIKAHTHGNVGIVGLAFSPDGRMLATCGFDEPVLRAWDPAAALNLLWETRTETAGISALAFSPDGKMIAAMVRHSGVNFFEASTGRREYGFPVEHGFIEVRSLAFSPDGKLVATGGDSGAAKLWNVETGRLHAALQGHTGTIRSVAFSPDGDSIATASDDQTVRLWDVAAGQERITLKGFQHGFMTVTYSPDGNTLAAGGLGDVMVRLWRASRVPEATAYGEQEMEAGQTDSPDAANYNSLSWPLATDPDPLKRDGQKAVRLAEKAVAATHRRNASYLDTLAAAYAETGQFAKAISIQKEAIALSQGEQGNRVLASRLKLYENNSPYRDHGALAELTKDRLRDGKFAEAEGPARECLAQREREIPDDWRTFNARSMLGGSLLGQKKYAEAEPLLLSGYEGMKQRENRIPAAGRPRLKETLQRLVQLYEATNRPDQAAGWKQKLAEFDKTEK
jgi:eukaryotic-like serine/threonine-protein kinase